MVDGKRINEDIEVSDESSSNTTSASSKQTCNNCSTPSTLEEEAMNALKEVAPSVKSISISEMLPRTQDLLFLNITTLEGLTFCVELCAKGYRVASARQDCMNGDFRQLPLHTRYFESIYQLLDNLSPAYREKIASLISSKLNELKNDAN